MFELGILDEFFASAAPESGTHCWAKPLKVPAILKLMQRWPILQRIPARAIGLGARREHVKTAEVHRPQKSAVA